MDIFLSSLGKVDAMSHETIMGGSEEDSRHFDEDETIALNAWNRIDCQTREAIKSLPHLLGIYEVRVPSVF